MKPSAEGPNSADELRLKGENTQLIPCLIVQREGSDAFSLQKPCRCCNFVNLANTPRRPSRTSCRGRHGHCMQCAQPPLHSRWELAVPRSEQWPSLQPSAGLPTLGDLSRLAAVGERLRRGCPLRLAALGGSSTAGHSLQRWSPALFHALLARRINATFPHPAHQHTNAGTPGTGPVYMEKCLRYELPAGDGGGVDLDLALVEYTQNNQYLADKVSLERLVRRLLALPSAPAVVLISFPVWDGLLCSDGAGGAGDGAPCRGDGIEETLVAPLAARYALPHVSLASLLRAPMHATGIQPEP